MFKNILIIFMCFNIISFPGYCIIEDDFVQKNLKSSKKQVVATIDIKDEFIEQTLNKNLKIKNAKELNITDAFAEKNTNKNIYNKPEVNFSEQIVSASSKIIKPKNNAIILDENSIPIKIGIKETFSTKQEIDEGDFVEFKTLSEIKIKNKIYPINSTVKARIETISSNKTWGVPSDLTVGNFSLDGIPLYGEINKTGANRSLWLYPTIYLSSMFFGVGFLLVPIRGGHAKIEPNQTYTIYYTNSQICYTDIQ